MWQVLDRVVLIASSENKTSLRQQWKDKLQIFSVCLLVLCDKISKAKFIQQLLQIRCQKKANLCLSYDRKCNQGWNMKPLQKHAMLTDKGAVFNHLELLTGCVEQLKSEKLKYSRKQREQIVCSHCHRKETKQIQRKKNGELKTRASDLSAPFLCSIFDGRVCKL